ncbi:MAG: peroxide stress protein YaaA [Pseudomonadota bacterium]
MLVVVSPAKKLDMSPASGIRTTQPAFLERAEELAALARGLSAQQLRKLMQISEALAQLNVERFAQFGDMDRKPAALAFAGDTYTGLEAASLDPDEMTWAQEHLRILSGLYGLLRPLDEIEPYRLEMGSRMKTPRGKTLYDYWGHTLSEALNEQARATESAVLVNCASQEYFGAVPRDILDVPVVTPVFKERRDGQLKIISFFAKQARGAMARFIVQNRLNNPKDLKDFDTGGYAFEPKESDENSYVFSREAA